MFLLFISLLAGFISYGQKAEVNVYFLNKQNKASNDTIFYDLNRKLTWADFQGKPDPDHFGGAVTASGFAFHSNMEYGTSGIVVNVYVYTYFNKRDSWKKPNINSDYHLLHEQTHFDITYLHAHQFAEDLKKAKFTVKNFRSLPGEIFNKIYDQNTAMQQQYDRETKHSILKEEQEVWNNKIAAMLEKYSGK